jgi:hypothetical protein
MVHISRNRVEIEQELILEIDSDKAISSESEGELHEDTMAAGDNNVTGSQDNKITFGQYHVIHGILVVSILSLELSVF